MTLDPVTGASTPCPAPAGSAGAQASGTTVITQGGQTTAFGNTWFTGGPIDGALNSGPGCAYLSDTTLVCAGQQAGNAVNIHVYRSSDGGVTLPRLFTTAATPGNLNVTGQLVKTAAGPYYMGLTVNGAFGNNPLRTVDLGTWTATSGVDVAPHAPTGTFFVAVGGTSGNTVLAFTSSSTARVCRLVSPASAFVCSAPASYTGPGGATAAQWVTGSTWLLIDTGSRVFRSTDDGTSFTLVTTLSGTVSGIGGRGVTCSTATVCLAVVGNTVHRSTDAGLTWTVVASGSADSQAFANFGGGSIIVLASHLSTATPQPGCLPNCQNLSGTIRTIDGGVTWVPASGPWLTIAGTGGGYSSVVTRANGTAVVTHSTANNGPTNAGRNYGYTTALPSGLKVLSRGEIPTIPIQGGLLLNSQTTGAAATAVVVTLTGVAGFRVHLWSLSARCGTGADTATITVAEGVTTRYSSAFTQVALVTQNSFDKVWPTGLTIGDGTSMVVTLGACTAGAGTLIVQADQF